ncbi:MAG TPA: YraN family protein [Lachnospiraceae bacterium]|nr:YraN family protein [Lachnospiraceae bacterium]
MTNGKKINNRRIGTDHETLAAAYLEKQGVTIIERNFRCRQGEADIIGYDEHCYLFIEVKYRRNNEKGSPAEAVNYRKQLKICKVADFYRISRKISAAAQIRFDVIAIQNDTIIWHKNAFYYIGSL